MSRNSQKKKHRTESQHYVPQFYLRGFTNSSGHMHCYDKVAGRSHPTSTAAAAQEPYFYEIPPGSFEKFNVPVNTVEKALGSVEKTWAPLHAALIQAADSGHITATLTIEYAPFLVTQWMRTKTYRDTMHEIAQKSMQSNVDDLVGFNFPGESATITVGKKTLPAMHSKMIFDQERVKMMAYDLGRHYWVIGINRTEHPFYTSDHPVVRRGNLIVDGRPGVGILHPGVEFAFPLDSKHILLILERTYFREWRKYDNKAVEMTAEQVCDYNSLQVKRSYQRVFCASDDFDVALEVCATHPEVRDPNRPRVRVETTPIVPAGLGEDGKEQWKNNISVTALE